MWHKENPAEVMCGGMSDNTHDHIKEIDLFLDRAELLGWDAGTMQGRRFRNTQ